MQRPLTAGPAKVTLRKNSFQPSAMPKIHQYKITLQHIQPPIWRRVLVPESASLLKLNDVILDAMGWEVCHLSEFRIMGEHYFLDAESVEELGGELMEDHILSDMFNESNREALFLYDFGDGWEHEVVLEAVLEPDASAKYPCCVAGEHNCPPEDCGGPWGYAELLAISADPDHPEHEETKEWLDDKKSPHFFSLKKVNKKLKGTPPTGA